MMSMYTEQHLYIFLERIAIALEDISTWVEVLAKQETKQETTANFVPPTAGSGKGSKSVEMLTGMQASQNTTVGLKPRVVNARSASSPQTPPAGSPSTTTTPVGKSAASSAPSVTPESSED